MRIIGLEPLWDQICPGLDDLHTKTLFVLLFTNFVVFCLYCSPLLAIIDNAKQGAMERAFFPWIDLAVIGVSKKVVLPTRS